MMNDVQCNCIFIILHGCNALHIVRIDYEQNKEQMNLNGEIYDDFFATKKLTQCEIVK